MKTRIFSILAIVGVVVASSCSDTLDVKSPTQISQEQALSDGGIDGLVLSAYAQMQGTGLWGSNQQLEADVLADNSLATFNSNRYASEYENDGAAGHIGIYNAIYTIINDLNLAILYVDEAPGVSDAERNQIKGEAFALRAMMYFELARSYGYEPGREVNGWTSSVILRLEPIEGAGDADFRPRSSNADVYAQIVSDLNTAIPLLNNNDNRRMTQAAAQTLLARAELYRENFAAAETAATNAMNSGLANLTTAAQYNDAWYGENHPEAFFELVFDPVLENVGPNNAMFSVASLVTGAWGDLAATPDLLAQFETGDVRRDQFYLASNGLEYQTKWTGSAGSNNIDAAGVPDVSSTWSDNVPILRYAEALLIRAEARLRGGNGQGATDDINTLRSNRGLPTVLSVNMADIEKERRCELNYEGHRWFDLKRMGSDVNKPVQGRVISYSDFRLLAPLPQAQVDLNPNMQQNPGY